MIAYNDREQFDQRHGGPFDRGSADSYYGRGVNPHYYKGNTYGSELVSKEEMTVKEIHAYLSGYDWNEVHGGKKEWD